MNDHCGLCGNTLTSIDRMLGENKLSDGNVLCNICLEKASNINQELLYKLHNFNINDIKNLIQNGTTIADPNNTNPLNEQNQNENLPVATHAESNLMSDDHRLYKKRLKEIRHQLKLVNANLSMFTRGEIKELPHILALDEPILAITDAQFLNTVDAGILLVTPKRMVSVSKAMFKPVKVNEFPNETINEVSFVKKFISPVIKLHTDEKIVEFECFYDKQDAEIFYNFIERIYNKEKFQKQQDTIKAVSTDTVLEQLEKLAQLRQNGILTETEFAEQKQKILGKL